MSKKMILMIIISLLCNYILFAQQEASSQAYQFINSYFKDQPASYKKRPVYYYIRSRARLPVLLTDRPYKSIAYKWLEPFISAQDLDSLLECHSTTIQWDSSRIYKAIVASDSLLQGVESYITSERYVTYNGNLKKVYKVEDTSINYICRFSVPIFFGDYCLIQIAEMAPKYYDHCLFLFQRRGRNWVEVDSENCKLN